MRDRLAMSPPWVHGLLAGGLVALLLPAFNLISGTPLLPALFQAGFTGVFLGLVMGRMVASSSAWMIGDAAELPSDALHEALRAASRGPVPTDPDVAGAALLVARRRLDYAVRTRTASTVVIVVFAALCFGIAAASTWWRLPTAGLLLLVIPFNLWNLRRLRRRVAALETAAAAS